MSDDIPDELIDYISVESMKCYLKSKGIEEEVVDQVIQWGHRQLIYGFTQGKKWGSDSMWSELKDKIHQVFYENNDD